MSDKTESIDPGALIRLSVIRLFLTNRFEDCEIIKCLDYKTGETCSVLFIPAMDPDSDIVYMTPAFAIPEPDMASQEDRYLPLETLSKSSPLDFKNN